MVQSELDAALLAPPRTGHLQGRTQRAAAARVPNQRDVLMGRGEDAREAVTNALEARQQHAKDTADLVGKALNNLGDGKDRYRRWKAKVGSVTAAEFIEFGKICVEPGYAYFRKRYIHEEGKLHSLYLAFKGAEIFDPLRVKEMSKPATMLQADLLPRFGFPEFNDEFVEALKKEIPVKSTRISFALKKDSASTLGWVVFPIWISRLPQRWIVDSSFITSLYFFIILLRTGIPLMVRRSTMKKYRNVMQEEVRAASGEPTHDPCPCPQPRRLQAPLFGPQVPPERPYLTNL